MELAQAILIVLELADQSVITDQQVADQDSLKVEQERQNEAIECVTKWARHALDVRY